MANTNYISRHTGEQIDNAIDKVGLLDTDVSTLKTDSSTLKTDVSNLNTDVSNLNNDVSNLNTNVDNLNTEVDNLDDGIGDVKTRLNKAENSILNVKSDVSDIKARNVIHLVTLEFDTYKLDNDERNGLFQVRFLFNCSPTETVTRNNLPNFLDNNKNNWISFLTFGIEGIEPTTVSTLKRPTVEVLGSFYYLYFDDIWAPSESLSSTSRNINRVSCKDYDISNFTDVIMN